MKCLNVGITGGIGSGKTTVASIFQSMGIPVYSADQRAKYLMTHDPHLIEGITDLFGSKAYILAENGTRELNAPYIASKVFVPNPLLERLNGLVHPAVQRDGQLWHDKMAAEHTTIPFTLNEAALTFESGGDRYMDKMITVFSPKLLRVRRVATRDGVTQKAVRARMDRQMDDREKVKLSDYVIYNDRKHELVPQVVAVYRSLDEIAQSYSNK